MCIIAMLMSCRDESLNPLPGWEPAVHGYGIFDGVAAGSNLTVRPQPYESNYAKNFPLKGQDATTAIIPMKVRWVSLDNKLTTSKIDIYLDMIEYYQDADGNDKQVSMGSKLLKSISAPAGNRQWNSFTVSATEAYNLFKDATVKYDKTNAVKVFANPANKRPTGQWFNGTEDFVISWVLTTTDGLVFKKFNEDSICADLTSVSEANSNCRLYFDVK